LSEDKDPDPLTDPDGWMAAKQEAIAEAGEMPEKDMREADVPWPKTLDELTKYIDQLVDRPHDYGTCCYAMSMAAVAALRHVAHKLGVTGFQASCADMDILRRTRDFDWGKFVNYHNLLYPQYWDTDSFPTPESIMNSDAGAEVKKQAAKELATTSGADTIRAHWQRLVDWPDGDPIASDANHEDEVYREGDRAFYEGKSEDDCPYAKDIPEHRIWCAGYRRKHLPSEIMHAP
jgi:ribosome modulation factor